MAAEAGDKRASKIQERINKIVPDIPKLTINVPKGANPRDAAVAIDGESVPASDMGRDLPSSRGRTTVTYNSKGERKDQDDRDRARRRARGDARASRWRTAAAR